MLPIWDCETAAASCSTMTVREGTTTETACTPSRGASSRSTSATSAEQHTPSASRYVFSHFPSSCLCRRPRFSPPAADSPGAQRLPSSSPRQPSPSESTRRVNSVRVVQTVFNRLLRIRFMRYPRTVFDG
jgi:hypothetical protein